MYGGVFGLHNIWLDKLNSRIRVRDGSSIRVTKDPWLPSIDFGFITSILDQPMQTY